MTETDRLEQSIQTYKRFSNSKYSWDGQHFDENSFDRFFN